MKLVNFITLRMSLLTAAVLAFWSVLFYICINIEINDEMDDTLEDYAEMIMRRHLAGHKLPSHDSGSNNQYRLFEVTAAQAAARPSVMYEDRDVYIKDKRETEPARVLSYIFMDSAGRHWLVEVSMPTIDKADMKEAILYLMLALFLLICIGVIIVNYLTLNRSIKPLHRLLAWLDAYRLGSKNKPLAEGKGIMEFDKLRQVATSSMQRNEQLYAQQKFFIGHASHEMQTPIAVC